MHIYEAMRETRVVHIPSLLDAEAREVDRAPQLLVLRVNQRKTVSCIARSSSGALDAEARVRLKLLYGQARALSWGEL